MVETDIRWTESQRIITRPRGPIAAFRLLLRDASALDALIAIEALTNPIARDAAGILATIPGSRRYNGNFADIVMTPFVIPNVSRFSDGSYGILYAADSTETALRESGHHSALRLRAARTPAGTTLPMFSFSLHIEMRAVDVRIRTGADPSIYDNSAYKTSQTFGRVTRDARFNGIYYDSVRYAGGECVALFFPDCVKDVTAGKQWQYRFDGSQIADYLLVE